MPTRVPSQVLERYDTPMYDLLSEFLVRVFVYLDTRPHVLALPGRSPHGLDHREGNAGER